MSTFLTPDQHRAPPRGGLPTSARSGSTSSQPLLETPSSAHTSKKFPSNDNLSPFPSILKKGGQAGRASALAKRVLGADHANPSPGKVNFVDSVLAATRDKENAPTPQSAISTTRKVRATPKHIPRPRNTPRPPTARSQDFEDDDAFENNITPSPSPTKLITLEQAQARSTATFAPNITPKSTAKPKRAKPVSVSPRRSVNRPRFSAEFSSSSFTAELGPSDGSPLGVIESTLRSIIAASPQKVLKAKRSAVESPGFAIWQDDVEDANVSISIANQSKSGFHTTTRKRLSLREMSQFRRSNQGLGKVDQTGADDLQRVLKSMGAQASSKKGTGVERRKTFGELSRADAEEETNEEEALGSIADELLPDPTEDGLLDDGKEREQWTGGGGLSSASQSQQSLATASQLLDAASQQQIHTIPTAAPTTPSRVTTGSKRRSRARDSPAPPSLVGRTIHAQGVGAPLEDSPNPRSRKSRKSVPSVANPRPSTRASVSGSKSAAASLTSLSGTPAERPATKRMARASLTGRAGTPSAALARKRVIPATERPVRTRAFNLSSPSEQGTSPSGAASSVGGSKRAKTRMSTGSAATKEAARRRKEALQRRHSTGTTAQHLQATETLPHAETPGSPGDDPLLLIPSKSQRARPRPLDLLGSQGPRRLFASTASGSGSNGEESPDLQGSNPTDAEAPRRPPSVMGSSSSQTSIGGDPVWSGRERSTPRRDVHMESPSPRRGASLTEPATPTRTSASPCHATQLQLGSNDRARRGLRGGSVGPRVDPTLLTRSAVETFEQEDVLVSEESSAAADLSATKQLAAGAAASIMSPVHTQIREVEPTSPAHSRHSSRRSSPEPIETANSESLISPEKLHDDTAFESNYMDEGEWRDGERESMSPSPSFARNQSAGDDSNDDVADEAAGSNEVAALNDAPDVRPTTEPVSLDNPDLVPSPARFDKEAARTSGVDGIAEGLDAGGNEEHTVMYPHHVLIRVVKIEALDDSPATANEALEEDVQDAIDPVAQSQIDPSGSNPSSTLSAIEASQKGNISEEQDAGQRSAEEGDERVEPGHVGNLAQNATCGEQESSRYSPCDEVTADTDDLRNDPAMARRDLSVVKIVSLDPRAAARAAAILRQHEDYIVSGDAAEVAGYHIDGRKDALKRRRSKHFDSIESASALTPEQQLAEAEYELAPGPRPCPPREVSPDHLVTRRISAIPQVDRPMATRRNIPLPPTLDWTIGEWRDLERCLRRARRSQRGKGKATQRFDGDDGEIEVSTEQVIGRFIEMRGLDERVICGTEWSRDMLAIRVQALMSRRPVQASQRARSDLEDDCERSPKPKKRPRTQVSPTPSSRPYITSTSTSSASFFTRLYSGFQSLVGSKEAAAASSAPAETRSDDQTAMAAEAVPRSATLPLPGAFPERWRNTVELDVATSEEAQHHPVMRQIEPAGILTPVAQDRPLPMTRVRLDPKDLRRQSQHRAAVDALFPGGLSSKASGAAEATSAAPRANGGPLGALGSDVAAAGLGILRPSRSSLVAGGQSATSNGSIRRVSLYSVSNTVGSPSVRDMARSYETSVLANEGDQSMSSTGSGPSRRQSWAIGDRGGQATRGERSG